MPIRKLLIDDYMDDFNSDDWLNQLDEDWEANLFSEDGEYQGGDMKGFFEVMEDFALYHEPTQRDYKQQWMEDDRRYNHAYVFDDRQLAKERRVSNYYKDHEAEKKKNLAYYHANKEQITAKKREQRRLRKEKACEET